MPFYISLKFKIQNLVILAPTNLINMGQVAKLNSVYMFNDQRGIAFHETRQLTSKTTNQYHTDVVGQWAIRHLDNSL